jgi:hypothetical protein
VYLNHLTAAELGKARDSADYLLGLGVRLDAVLMVKLDTFRADVIAAIEDREPATLHEP